MFLSKYILLTLQLIVCSYNVTKRQSNHSPRRANFLRKYSKFNHTPMRRHKEPAMIQNLIWSAVPECNALFELGAQLVLDTSGGNLVNAAHGTHSIWSIIWNVVARSTVTSNAIVGLSQNEGLDQLVLAQTLNGGGLLENISNANVDYSTDTQTFSQARTVCRVKVSDPDISAIIYDIYSSYHLTGPQNWFFCLDISINLYLTADDDINLGVDSRKMHMSVIFEDTCDESGPTPLSEEVYRIENLSFDKI
eukprot:GAHX01002720.1.p1 GENE.GAHX01002720.1~~GAHX01002720.1.p1  ORF type:complete len:250 (-),score=30.90 GAHX01002720.1:85-834(-)